MVLDSTILGMKMYEGCDLTNKMHEIWKTNQIDSWQSYEKSQFNIGIWYRSIDD